MNSEFGWTHISRIAVQRAEAQLADDSQGILDEIGLLQLHQGYADRFFPGTSVLHTRLRYVLFVAWTYEDFRRRRGLRGDIARAVALQERALGEALKRNTTSWGVIGRRRPLRQSSQRPSMIYWGALATWGILHRHPDGRLQTRSEVERRLAERLGGSQLKDDENRVLRSDESAFIALPPIPAGWPGGKGVDFDFTKEEQGFLREVLSRVREPGATRPSLLARLAAESAGRTLAWETPLLCREVKEVAEDDLPVLCRADQAGSLAAIARGIYSALVEYRCIRDGLGDRKRGLENLNAALAQHRNKALMLDTKALRQDLSPRLEHDVWELIVITQDWLKCYRVVEKRSDLKALLAPYRDLERRRKGGRARLAPSAVPRRQEWWQDKARRNEAPPEPLHYRWKIAVGLLRDLENRDG